MDKVYIYCDGGCRGNGKKNNVGGWGVYLIYKNNTKCLYGSAQNTTNNIMELIACIKGLEAIKKRELPIEVLVDSNYVYQGITQWIYSWMKKGWINSKKEPVQNKKLWQELYTIKESFSYITFTKVKGHSDNIGNNIADALVNKAMDELEEFMKSL